MKRSLKTKLMINFFILISIPMGILGYISYTMTANSLQKSVELQLRDQASDASELIEKTIELVKHSLEIASLDNDISKVVKNSSINNIEPAFEYIQKVQKNNQDYMEVLIITDAYGKVIMDSQTKEQDLDLSDRDYMKKALNSGEVVVSEVSKSRFTGNAAIFIAYPIKDGDKVIGTVVGSIKFDTITNYASIIKIGQSGYAYMIDKNGLIVYHPDTSKILKENASDNANGKLKEIIDEMKAGKTSEGFYDYENVYKYTAFQPANNWVIAVVENYDEYMTPAISIRNNTIIIGIISIIIAMIYAYVYSTISIVKPVKKLEKLMKNAGEGDLTVKAAIKSQDEIGQLCYSFNNMIKHQDEIVRSVINTSKQLNDASEELAATSEEITGATEEICANINQIAQDAQKQNQSIINVSEVLVQLASLVNLAQNRAQVASTKAVNTMVVAYKGREKVDETVKIMDFINLDTEETSKALKSVNDLSIKVEGIIDTINSIAKATNLLALNAAIEAARAGEQGKGFSIVADEVRKLAEESDIRAKEIAEIIIEMMSQTQNAVIAMERTKTEVNNGVIIVSETDKAFINIIKSIEEIVEQVNGILEITGDEVASSDKVVELINEIATVIESNSANSENIACGAEEQTKAMENLTLSAEETSSMAEELAILVEKFKI